ncbi:hypothetical protein KY334_07830 [Candidatus Woesearchaeota archaeon]|nr:hypothetical protein [Candidatus Woesearchaeota archaeon]
MIKKLIPLFVLLLLVSCTTSGPDYNYRTGTEGIKVEFLEGIYDTIYENEDLIISLNIENLGAYDSNNIYFSVFTERDVIDNPTKSFEIGTLEGRKLNKNFGDVEYKDIETKVKKIFVAEEINSKIRIDYCYPYESFLSAEICVDSDPRDEFEQNIAGCPTYDKSFTQGQGGPVAITYVDPVFVPSGNGVIPKFKIIVENVGDGVVVNYGNYKGACQASSYDKSNYGVIDVDDVYLGNVKLTCNRNKLTVEEVQRGNEFYEADRAVMTCTGELIEKQEMYATLLRIGIKYGYKDSVEQEINVFKENYIES